MSMADGFGTEVKTKLDGRVTCQNQFSEIVETTDT
jgi:hypothetical protein